MRWSVLTTKALICLFSHNKALAAWCVPGTRLPADHHAFTWGRNTRSTRAVCWIALIVTCIVGLVLLGISYPARPEWRIANWTDRNCGKELRPPNEAASWNKRTVSRVNRPMDGTGVSGSSSGQAVGFDPGGLSHFCKANPGHCEIQRPPTEAALHPGLWRTVALERRLRHVRASSSRRLASLFRFWIEPNASPDRHIAGTDRFLT
jgi:hypothetical protein